MKVVDTVLDKKKKKKTREKKEWDTKNGTYLNPDLKNKFKKWLFKGYQKHLNKYLTLNDTNKILLTFLSVKMALWLS